MQIAKHHEQNKAAQLGEVANELRAILAAQKAKTALQQKNLVAVQEIVRNDADEIQAILIRVMPLPDALTLFSQPPVDTSDKLNRAGMLSGWVDDGYDIQTSAALRPV